MSLNLSDLRSLPIADLVSRARDLGIDNAGSLKKQELIFEFVRREAGSGGGAIGIGVFETLPESMQEAFEKKDTQMLQVALEAMDPAEAKKHMDACEASGLWVQNNASEEATVADDGLA